MDNGTFWGKMKLKKKTTTQLVYNWLEPVFDSFMFSGYKVCPNR